MGYSGEKGCRVGIVGNRCARKRKTDIDGGAVGNRSAGGHSEE